MLNQTVCGIDNSLGRAVVLFQLEKFGIIEMASEIQDIINISTTETIDTLRIITHRTDTLLFLTKLHHDIHLNLIGILILIHKNEIKAVSIFPSDILMITEQLEGKGKQIIKVHSVSLLTTLNISSKNLPHLRHLLMQITLEDFTIGSIFIRSHQLVFCHRNLMMYGSWLVNLIIQPHLFDNSLEQGARIGLVINSEIIIEAKMRRFCAQNT